MEYTLDMHVQVMEEMVESDFLCEQCPNNRASNKFDFCFNNQLYGCRGDDLHPVGKLCRSFVGVTEEDCPCFVLGPEEARRRLIQALNEYHEGKE